MWTSMGCAFDKVPDPNEMYGDAKVVPAERNNSQEDNIKYNGHAPTTENSNGNCVKDKKNEMNKTLKGDLLLRSDARVQRQRKIKDKEKQRELRAQEMSGRIMDEKEMLSLVSYRSRATSRTASPKNRNGCNKIHPDDDDSNGQGTASPSSDVSQSEENQPKHTSHPEQPSNSQLGESPPDTESPPKDSRTADDLLEATL